MNELDIPVWASLAHQPHWAEGGLLSRRFKPDINRFAAARDDGADSLAALAGLVGGGDDAVFIAQVPPVAVPSGLVVVKAALGVQMLATRRLPVDEEVEVLGAAIALYESLGFVTRATLNIAVLKRPPA